MEPKAKAQGVRVMNKAELEARMAAIGTGEEKVAVKGDRVVANREEPRVGMKDPA